MGRPQRTTAVKRQELDDTSKEYDKHTQANEQSSTDSMSPPPRQGDMPAAAESVDPDQTGDQEESDPDMEIGKLLATSAGSDNTVATETIATNTPNMGKGASRNSKSKGKGRAPKG